MSTRSKRNDLHLHIGHRDLVMVQWGEVGTPFEDTALLTTAHFDEEDDKPSGMSVSLSPEERVKVVAALEGTAPPCTCTICSGAQTLRFAMGKPRG